MTQQLTLSKTSAADSMSDNPTRIEAEASDEANIQDLKHSRPEARRPPETDQVKQKVPDDLEECVARMSGVE